MTEPRYIAVAYDRCGSLAGTTFHGSVDDALASALAEGCRYLSVGEHPKAKTTRHFAREGDGWREVEADELDRLMSTEEPRMFWRAA